MKDGHYFTEDGGEAWFQNGKYHRMDGPAIIWSNGTKEWYQNGKRHREDGPAIIWSGERNAYFLNDISYPQIKNDVFWRIEVHRMKRKAKVKEKNNEE